MQKLQLKSRQRGVSFVGLVFVGVVLAALGVVGAQVVPTVIEYQTILKAVNKASTGSTVPEVRSIFNKATMVEEIHSITGSDLDVSKDGDKVVVAFAYNKEIHLVGPAFLLIKYSGRSN
jgi:hypothetical protein